MARGRAPPTPRGGGGAPLGGAQHSRTTPRGGRAPPPRPLGGGPHLSARRGPARRCLAAPAPGDGRRRQDRRRPAQARVDLDASAARLAAPRRVAGAAPTAAPP